MLVRKSANFSLVALIAVLIGSKVSLSQIFRSNRTTSEHHGIIGQNRAKLNNNAQAPVRTQSPTDSKCLMCRFSVSLVNYALKTKRGYDQIDRIANNFCVSAHLEAPLVCSKISKLFNSEITKVLTYGLITPDQLCGLLSNNTCGHFRSPLDEWEINLEASERINRTELDDARHRSVIFANETSEESYRVIHISDTHVDLNYAAGSPAICEEPLCCQLTSTPKNDTANPSREKAGYWGTYGACDIPLRTFVATLKQLNETLGESSDIKYIIWTGDIQPHDIWSQDKQSALQVYETVFKRIFKYLPNVIILPTLGNHEMVPVDSFSPSNLLAIAQEDSPNWLYRKLDASWSHWLPRETEATITRDGFYAATVRPGLKVISLNTNFCHSRNFWLFINSTDPGNQLQWLVHELQLSELSHEKVHIIGHIPPGADDCMRVWSRNYHRIINRYVETVTGQFFGHTHTSEFEMFYSDSNETLKTSSQERVTRGKPLRTVSKESQTYSSAPLVPISVAQIGPSITTFFDLNPSYRIYTINPKQNFQPIDYETFFVNLTQANQLGKSARPKWHSAGFITEKFDLKDITPPSMHELLTSVAASLNQSELGNKSLMGAKSDDSDKENVNEEVISKIGSIGSRSSSSARNLKYDDKLYELYRLFNSYSDKFTKAKYENITLEDRKKFVCRLLTSRSHDHSSCRKIIPTIDLPYITM